MPLSEQEQRLLEEMERSLYHNDAEFVAAVSSRHGRPTYSSIVAGVLIGLAGVAALITGVVIRQPIVGVIGFVIMLVGVLVSFTPPRGGRTSPADGRDASAGDHRSGTFTQNPGGREPEN